MFIASSGVQYWFFDTGLVAVLRENQNGFTILRTSTMSPSLSSDVYVAVVGGAKFLAVKGNSVKLLTYSGGTYVKRLPCYCFCLKRLTCAALAGSQ